MGVFKNYTGKRYGRLIVQERAPNKGTSLYGRNLWKCLCDCGNVCIVYRGHLTNKHTKSCGCLVRNADPGARGRKMLFYVYKSNAKQRNLPFDLTMEDISQLSRQNCHYCDKPPLQISKVRNRGNYVDEKSRYKYNGLDRVIPTLGYVLSNVVPCCIQCNIAKHTYSLEDFQTWIRAVYLKLEKHNAHL